MTFREILEEYGIPIAPEGHHHQTHGWIQFDCPFCGPDTHSYHMGYNIKGGYLNCWKCGGHSLDVTLRFLLGVDFGKIKNLTAEIDGKVPDITDERTGLYLPPKGLLATLTGHSALSAHRKYLKKRGFDPKEIESLWNVCGTGPVGVHQWRLFIPITYRGKEVSWTTRSLRDRGQRYISAKANQEAIPHKHILYGMDYIRHTAIIVEGPLDVWAIGPGAIATFGTAFTEQQVLKLLDIPRRIVCFDSDPKAQKQAKKLCDALGPFEGETINVTLDSADPGSAKLKELKKLRKFLE